MGITYETQSEQGFCRIRLKMAETYAWKGFEYDLPHVAEPVPIPLYYWFWMANN
jgi:hypothetical protein